MDISSLPPTFEGNTWNTCTPDVERKKKESSIYLNTFVIRNYETIRCLSIAPRLQCHLQRTRENTSTHFITFQLSYIYFTNNHKIPKILNLSEIYWPCPFPKSKVLGNWFSKRFPFWFIIISFLLSSYFFSWGASIIPTAIIWLP